MSHILDSSAWLPRPQGLSEGSKLLARAEEILCTRHDNPNAYEKALRLLRLARNYHLETPESLRRADLLALCNAELGDHAEALVWLSEAHRDAERLELRSLMPRLMARRAASHHYLLHIRAACHDLDQILYEWRLDGALPVLPDIIFELDCRLRLAIVRFFLGEFGAVKRHLDRAMNLIQQVPLRHSEEATVKSLMANLYFWQEQPMHTLAWALQAADIYTREHEHESAGRTHILIAEALLSIAANLPNGTARDAKVDEAGHFISLAENIAARCRDEILADLVFLVRAQLDLTAGQSERADRQADDILDRATDPLILARAWTTKGDCGVNNRQIERAVTAYRCALIVLEHTELPAHGERARKALARYSESTLA